MLVFSAASTLSQVGFSGREFAWTDRSGSLFLNDILRELREEEERSFRKRSSGELSTPSDSSKTVCARHTPATAVLTEEVMLIQIKYGGGRENNCRKII